jgi:hypothetical protein
MDLDLVQPADTDTDWLFRNSMHTRYDDTFDFDVDDLFESDVQVLVSTISAICGAACGELTSQGEDHLNSDRESLYKAVIDTGFDKLSKTGQDKLSDIFDVLREQLGDLASGSVNPFEVSQYWTQQFDQYEDWQFARLARTESAFAQSSVKLDWWRKEGVSDEALMQLNALTPIHPSCKCEMMSMACGDSEYLYLDTSMEPCEICNDLADRVISLIFDLAGAE